MVIALNIEKNKTFSFVFVGDLVQETKNVKGIIEAFSEVLKHHKDIKMDIIGDGKDLKNYNALSNRLKLNNHVSFHGNRNNDYVIKTYLNHVLIKQLLRNLLHHLCRGTTMWNPSHLNEMWRTGKLFK